jgi:hypothetical protein
MANTADESNKTFANRRHLLRGVSDSGVGDYDIAYAESNDLGTANATGLSDLIDILKQYDDWAANGGLPTVDGAAAESGGHLTDLLSGSSGAAADASNLWTDLVSGLDGGGAAADASNFWTDLASLF